MSDILSARVVKRSITIAGHATSVSIEKPFWDALKDIAVRENRSMTSLIADIDDRRATNLSSAVRLYVLASLQSSMKQPV